MKLEYADCINDPELYLKWIIQVFGEILTGRYEYDSHLSGLVICKQNRGMAHIHELSRRTGQPAEEILDAVKREMNNREMEDLAGRRMPHIGYF